MHFSQVELAFQATNGTRSDTKTLVDLEVKAALKGLLSQFSACQARCDEAEARSRRMEGEIRNLDAHLRATERHHEIQVLGQGKEGKEKRSGGEGERVIETKRPFLFLLSDSRTAAEATGDPLTHVATRTQQL